MKPQSEPTVRPQPALLSELERVRDGEQLRPITRSERRLLLAVAMLAIAVAHTGLVPTRISALGIEFSGADQRALLAILLIIVGYLTSTFAIYAATDFLAWRSAHDSALLAHLRHDHAFVRVADSPDDKPWERAQKQIGRRLWWWGTLARKMSGVRAVWEFLLPLLVGAYAIGAVYWSRSFLG